jgi:hypothetical protein
MRSRLFHERCKQVGYGKVEGRESFGICIDDGERGTTGLKSGGN